MNPLAKAYKNKLRKTREEIIQSIKDIVTKTGDMELCKPCRIHIYKGRFQQAATANKLFIRQLELFVNSEEFGTHAPSEIKTNDLLPLLDAVEETVNRKS